MTRTRRARQPRSVKPTGMTFRHGTGPVTPALIFAILTVFDASNAWAADPVRQPKIDMCQGCHGIPGYRTAYPEVYSVPKLGGQKASYIIKSLKDYRSGLRRHATMRSIAAELSDLDIAAIAAYYAGE